MKFTRRRVIVLLVVLLPVCAILVAWWFDDGGELAKELAKAKTAKTRWDLQEVMGSMSMVFGIDSPEHVAIETESGPIGREDYPLNGSCWRFDDGEVMVVWDRHLKVRHAWMNRDPLHERIMRWVRKKTGL